MGIATIFQFQNILTEKNRYLSIVFLPLKSGLVDKFDQPLHNRKDIVDIQTLQLKWLKRIRTFHVYKRITDVL